MTVPTLSNESRIVRVWERHFPHPGKIDYVVRGMMASGLIQAL